MNKDSFIIQDVEPRNELVEYVVLQAGRGKTKFSSIYVSSFAFSYFEGLIWDKYREYSMKKKVKIPKQEWIRIIGGVEIAINHLETRDETADIESILKFSIINPRYPLSMLSELLDDFLGFAKELVEWLLNQTTQESTITVIKKHA
jgi:hypothetical protein